MQSFSLKKENDNNYIAATRSAESNSLLTNVSSTRIPEASLINRSSLLDAFVLFCFLFLLFLLLFVCLFLSHFVLVLFVFFFFFNRVIQFPTP